ncbi:MAG: 7-cyano-7-deazaguanine synthase, partial [Selenomonas sp.]|nr:7-cyano-7-deazaguanine synthase [Selenomonas sp.]
IAAKGKSLGIDYAETWSCYKGGEKHCGRCGTCVERKYRHEHGYRSGYLRQRKLHPYHGYQDDEWYWRQWRLCPQCLPDHFLYAVHCKRRQDFRSRSDVLSYRPYGT